MDREKAADLLDNLIGMVEDNHGADYDTALKMGIEALRASGDIIYRHAAIDAISEWGLIDGLSEGQAIEILGDEEKVPPVQPNLQPTCNQLATDYISRQAATDGVQGIGRLATLPDNDAVIRMSAVEYVLFNLPSAQPEQQWIPCNWHKDTENLPDECKSVLICIKDKIGMYVDVSYRTDYNRWERYGRNVNVVAWRELPEPWRGEEHETD